jgi:hypothetical protein
MGTLVNTYYEQLLVFKNVLIDAATAISPKISLPYLSKCSLSAKYKTLETRCKDSFLRLNNYLQTQNQTGKKSR